MIRIAAIACNKTEDIELITAIDLWRRAGFRVDTISLEKKNSIVLNSGVKISCDNVIEKANLEQYNAIYLPGGPGHEKYFIESWTAKNNEGIVKLHKCLLKFNEMNKHILAICAAPKLLGTLEILGKRKGTCYPGYQTTFAKSYVDVPVFKDKNIITGRSPAATMEFAFTVIEELAGKAEANKVKKQIIYS